jgi:sugar O-acyltransferase (sialic acid O-acetyltransferase NeuD family)
VADVAVCAGYTIAGFVDDNASAGLDALLPFPLLGDRAFLLESPLAFRVALSVGDQYARLAVAEFLRAHAIEMATIISPSAVISPSALIGVGTVIMPSAVVNSRAVIGEGVIINTGAIVEHDVKIGHYAHLSPGATLGGGSEVGECAHVGIGAMVLPSISIGARSVLGAGSVATRAIPDDVVAFGIPARVQRAISR